MIRQGKETEVLASQLVPGDIIVLEEGDNISADARLTEAYQMKIDSSTLTGESKPVRKIADSEENNDENIVSAVNLVLAGTNVSSGSGKAVIFATGSNTEFNKIAALTQNVKEEPSPLQKQLARLTQIIVLIAILMGVTLFFLNIYVVKLSLSIAFLFAIGLTVANVPEGLLPTVTLALAASVKKMVGKNALIKRLSSVETLGSTNIICTDKTGTLTQNQMTVRKIWIPYDIIDVTGVGYKPEGDFLQDGGEVCHKDVLELKLLMRSATFANDAKIVSPSKPGERWKIYGDPTEAALLVAARKNGFDWESEIEKHPRIFELPFDSKRKSMSSIHMANDKKVAYIKGAPKKIIRLCNEISVEGTPINFTEEAKKEVINEHDKLAASGLRILGMAYRDLPSDFDDYNPETVEKDMIFLGMMAMQDPPRPEVLPAVADCHKAGIRIIMITGDYGLTARSIVQEVGIVDNKTCRIVKGKELTAMSDDELKTLLKRGEDIIFARAVQEHKMRIASVLEDMDDIVAMTGDGVNDAPALRKADRYCNGHNWYRCSKRSIGYDTYR